MTLFGYTIFYEVSQVYVISGLRHEVFENRAVLGQYTAGSCNSSPTFRDNHKQINLFTAVW
jgi:hypothetical protein